MTPRIVFVDTAPFIYLFEDHPQFGEVVARLFQDWEAKGVQLITSTLTYLEIVTWPLKSGFSHLVDQYRSYFTNSENLAVLPLSLREAEAAAGIRAKYGLKTPDAIQVATAQANGADVFLTNDRDLGRVSGLPVRLLSEEPVPQGDRP